MTDVDFAKKALSLTGKNIYEIELEIAIGRCVNGHGDASDCWEYAEDFMLEMKKVYQKRYDRQRPENT